jgi:hypothetical protein
MSFNIKHPALACIICFLCLSCEPEDHELTQAEQRASDSVSKAGQRTRADSLRKTNPLLIVPPDSTYTGDYTDKYPNGITKFKGFFRFGERHGQWLSFYPNGERWSELHYDKGLRHGPNIVYFENGKMRYQGSYKMDMQDSVWDYFDSTGVLVEKVLFKNDRVVKHLPLN